MNKRFWVINIDEHNVGVEMEVHSSTPREAALKAATRDMHHIYIVDTASGKLHVFHGSKVQLRETEENEFTRKRNITAKPVVRKIGYLNLKTSLTRTDLPDVARELRRMVS